MPRNLILYVVLLLVLLTAPGCVRVSESEAQVDSPSIDLGKAELVNVNVEFAAGELSIEGGARKLLESELHYSFPGLKPEVRYDETSFRGHLNLRQTGASKHGGRKGDSWDVRLNDSIPMDIHARIGAGEGKLDLSSLKLRRVEVEMGAGKLRLDLTGDYEKDFDVRIRGGVGAVTVKLPKNVGVQARAHGGLGNIQTPGMRYDGHVYTNRAFGKSKVTVDLDVQGGIGQINLEGE